MNLDNVNVELVTELSNKAVDYSLTLIPGIISAILVLWIGLKIVKMINKMVQKVMDKNDWDPMLESFISSLLSIVLKVLVIITAAGMLGVQTTSFIAMLAAA